MPHTTMELLGRDDALVFGDPLKPISRTSVWSDQTWRLDTHEVGISKRGVSFNWGPGICDDMSEVDASILEDFRKLIWIALVDRKIPFLTKPAAAPSMAAACTHLMRYMRRCGLSSFADLTAEQVDLYVQSIIDWLGNEQIEALTESDRQVVESETEEGLASKSDTDEPSPRRRSFPTATVAERAQRRRTGDSTMARSRIDLLSRIWKLRKQLEVHGVPVPAKDPLSGRTPSEVANFVQRRVEDAIPPLPDEVFLAVVNACERIISVHARDVMDAQAEWLRLTGGFGRECERKRAWSAVYALPFTSREGGRTAGRLATWPENMRDFHEKDMSDALRAGGTRAERKCGLRNLIHSLRDASIVVIAACTGMRTSELLSIPGGWDDGRDLPNCIVRRVSDDGLLELFFVIGSVMKNKPVPVQDEWLVGARAAGSTEMPIAVAAVSALERLMAPWRMLSNDEVASRSLLVSLNGRGMPTAAHSVGRLTAKCLATSLRRLYRNFVDFDRLPDRGSNEVDIRPYKSLNGGCIVVHQFRKHYGKFLYRFDSRLLPPLKRQFKHMLLATTRTSYIGRNPNMLSGPDDEAVMAGNRAVAALLGSTPQGGRLHELISRHDEDQKSNTGHGGCKPVDGAAMARTGLDLIRGAHGSCGISFAPSLSRCNAASGLASFLNTRPDFGLRGPEVCSGCPVFLVDRSNVPYWRRRYLISERIWRQACRRGLEREYARARKQSQQARAMLRMIGYERYEQ